MTTMTDTPDEIEADLTASVNLVETLRSEVGRNNSTRWFKIGIIRGPRRF